MKRALAGIATVGTIVGLVAIAPSASAGKPPPAPTSVVQFSPSGTAFTATEGQPGSISVVITRSSSAGTASFNVDVVPGSASLADVTLLNSPPDWTNPITMAPGVTTRTMLLGIVNDSLTELTEALQIKLTNPSSGTQIGKKNTANLTILDNDPCSPVSINDSSATEGSPITFTVSMAAACALPVQVHYATASNGDATPGADYTSKSGNVAIAAGDTSATFQVATLQDTTDEPNQTFNVNLSAPVGTTIVDALGVGTINDDDAAPGVTMSDNPTAVEGNDLIYTIALSAASEKVASGTFETWPGNAADVRYVPVVAGLWSIAAGNTTTTVHVPTTDDALIQVANQVVWGHLLTATNALIDTSFGGAFPDFSGSNLALNDAWSYGTLQDNDDTDGDGVSNANDLCPGTTAGDPVDVNGCSASQVDTDSDGVPDITDNCDTTANPGQEDVDGYGAGDACDNYTEIAGTSTGTEDGTNGSFAGAIDNTSNGGLGHPDGTYAGQFTGASAPAALAECGGGDGFYVDGTVTLTYGSLDATFDLDMSTSYFCVDVLGATPALTTYTAHWEGSMTSGTGPWTGATGSVTYNGKTGAQNGSGVRADTLGVWSGFVDLV